MTSEKKRILIVDDDEGIRKSMARLLGIEGHEVCVAKDGFEALQMCESFHPDLLVIDIRMPGIDGVETFRRLRHQMPGIVAIFMTAYSASDRTAAAIDDGALHVFSKPLDLTEMFAVIHSALDDAPVLVADDDPQLLNSLRRALQSEGVAVETAGSLKEAARLLRQRPGRVVIADVYFQDGFGYELLADLADANSALLILITGHLDWLDTDTAHGLAGRAEMIPKPLDLQKLLAQVKHR